LAIGFVDWLTGPEMAFSIFYLIPVMLAAWLCDRKHRFAISALSGVTWLLAELFADPRYSYGWIPYWNACVRLGTFLISSELTAHLAARKQMEKALLAAQNDALQKEVAERKAAETRLQLLNQNLERIVAERTAAAEHRSRDLARSEAELRKQTKVLQSILNSMGDGVLVIDASGNVVLSNPEADRILEVPLCGTNCRNWLEKEASRFRDSPGDASGWEDPLLKAIRGQAVDGVETVIRRSRPPENMWLRTTVRPLLDESGATQGGVLVFNDITNRRVLEAQIAEVSEREQRRIGQDLHDGVCQLLVSNSFACGMLAQTLTDKALAEAQQAGEIGEAIRGTILHIRNLARSLFPVELMADGLPAALEELAGNVHNLTNILCRFDCDGPVRVQDPGIGTNLYRIAQEALNNAVRHSGATRISIELSSAGDALTLGVRDDGVGFSTANGSSSGMGLHLMNYRARIIGAFLDIQSGSGGTTVQCTLSAFSQGE
jgi:signal transduction histidine kinase